MFLRFIDQCLSLLAVMIGTRRLSTVIAIPFIAIPVIAICLPYLYWNATSTLRIVWMVASPSLQGMCEWLLPEMHVSLMPYHVNYFPEQQKRDFPTSLCATPYLFCLEKIFQVPLPFLLPSSNNNNKDNSINFTASILPYHHWSHNWPCQYREPTLPVSEYEVHQWPNTPWHPFSLSFVLYCIICPDERWQDLASLCRLLHSYPPAPPLLPSTRTPQDDQTRMLSLHQKYLHQTHWVMSGSERPCCLLGLLSRTGITPCMSNPHHPHPTPKNTPSLSTPTSPPPPTSQVRQLSFWCHFGHTHSYTALPHQVSKHLQLSILFILHLLRRLKCTVCHFRPGNTEYILSWMMCAKKGFGQTILTETSGHIYSWTTVQFTCHSGNCNRRFTRHLHFHRRQHDGD